MSTSTGLNIGASAYVPASKPTFVPQPVPRNPALAFLLSLLLPGLGQFYCRKNSRGAWTLIPFLIALGVIMMLGYNVMSSGIVDLVHSISNNIDAQNRTHSGATK